MSKNSGTYSLLWVDHGAWSMILDIILHGRVSGLHASLRPRKILCGLIEMITCVLPRGGLDLSAGSFTDETGQLQENDTFHLEVQLTAIIPIQETQPQVNRVSTPQKLRLIAPPITPGPSPSPRHISSSHLTLPQRTRTSHASPLQIPPPTGPKSAPKLTPPARFSQFRRGRCRRGLLMCISESECGNSVFALAQFVDSHLSH